VLGVDCSVYQISDRSVVAARRIRVGKYPVGIAMTPNGKTAYVSRRRFPAGYYNYPSSVLPISVTTGKPGPAISTPRSAGMITGPPLQLDVTPGGGTLYVLSSKVSGKPGAVLTPIRQPSGRHDPSGFADWSSVAIG